MHHLFIFIHIYTSNDTLYYTYQFLTEGVYTKAILKLIFAGFLLCLLCACAERRKIKELGFVVGATYN